MTPPLSSYWLELATRYFEGLTSEVEEQELRNYLAKSHDIRPLLQSARAVMCIAAVERRAKQTNRLATSPYHRRQSTLRRIAAIALLTLSLEAAWWCYDYLQPQSLAYVNGERITDPLVIDLHMQQALRHTLSNEASSPTLEGQLHDIFSTLNAPEATLP